VASAHALPDLEARLNPLGAANEDGAAVLRGVASLLCAPPGVPSAAAELAVSSARCVGKRSRGIVMVAAETAPQTGEAAAATVIRAEPGDDVVVLQHEIAHVAPAGS
jgi:hypothetical protein